WSCELCRGNHDFLWRVQERLGDGSLSHLPNRDGACALGSGDFHGLYAAGLSQDIHGDSQRAMERDCRSSIQSPCSNRSPDWPPSLLRILPAIVCANPNADLPELSLGKSKPPHGYAEL